MGFMFIRILGGCAGLLTLGMSIGLAQSPTATVVGRITDASGALVPGATIQIRSQGTGAVRQVTADESAEFTVPNLAPGLYDVIVERQGFRTLREDGLELQVDQTARLDVTLEVGSVTETVEVTAALPVLNTENASRGDVIVSQEVLEMPLDGRDFNNLAFLVPGVSRAAQGSSGSNLSVNGARQNNSNFFVDGFNNQNVRQGNAQARPPIDAVQEFKMQVSGYSAEYGRLAGGVMNLALKSGTNQLHGSLFEFLRNDIFDARNFFDVDKSKLRRNQFGAVANGPVYIPKVYDGHNRTFFLGSWESYRQVIGVNQLGRVPGDLERAGDFSQTTDASGKKISLQDPLSGAPFPGNKIPAARIHPAAAKAMAFYPAANRPGQVNNYVANADDNDQWDSFLGKVDHRFGDSDSISVRYMRRLNDTMNPFSANTFSTFANHTKVRQSLGGITYTRMFTPVLINEARAGFSRTTSRKTADTIGTDYASQLGIPGGTTDPELMGFPRITIRDQFALGPGGSFPNSFAVTNYQFGDTLTWVKSRHLMKFGGDVMRTQFFQPYNNNNRGTMNFLGRWTNAPLADFELGFLNNSSRQVGSTRNYLFTTSYGFFIQDDYKASSSLTLNIGLRYDQMRPPVEKYDKWTNFIPQYGKLILVNDRVVSNLAQLAADAGLSGRIGFAGDYGLPRSLVYGNNRNFAPRAGLAWRPFGGARSVVRAGYGIFFASESLNEMRTDLGSTFPFALSQSFQRNNKDPNRLTLSKPFPDALVKLDGVNNTAGYELHPAAQYLQSWNLTIEHELFSSVALEMAYVGSKGTHLGRRYNFNEPYRSLELQLPGGGFPRPFQEFNTLNYYSFGSNSSYNAAMFSLRKRFSRGTFFRVNYTFSKSIDESSQTDGAGDGGDGKTQDARNLRLERGRSDWDNRHAFTMSFVSDLPFLRRNRFLGGWQLAGSGRVYSGQPFTPVVSNAQEDQGEAIRPDRIANGTLSNPTPERWFDVSAFPAVPLGSYRFGNSGRNILDGPGFVGVNLSMMKKFQIREKDNIQFRWEVFNVINHANLDLPVIAVNAVNVGTITGSGNGRTMQFALKYIF